MSGSKERERTWGVVRVVVVVGVQKTVKVFPLANTECWRLYRTETHGRTQTHITHTQIQVIPLKTHAHIYKWNFDIGHPLIG